MNLLVRNGRALLGLILVFGAGLVGLVGRKHVTHHPTLGWTLFAFMSFCFATGLHMFVLSLIRPKAKCSAVVQIFNSALLATAILGALICIIVAFKILDNPSANRLWAAMYLGLACVCVVIGFTMNCREGYGKTLFKK
jgi:hypothetical protein